MRYKQLFLFVLPVFFLITCLKAQVASITKICSEKLQISPGDSVYSLKFNSIIKESDTVFVDSIKLKRYQDYRINYTKGEISFSRDFLKRITTDSSKVYVSIMYKAILFGFREEYNLHRLDVKRDSSGLKKSVITPAKPSLFSDNIFGANIQKSGSIVRGFSVGSNRDFSLTSGFRMQLVGKLAQDVDVTAALTDEKSPIQPEGTTQTLREVDKVFIEVKNPTYSATLGDFYFQCDEKQGGEFGRINRKLQGGQGNVKFYNIKNSANDLSFSLTGATTRGKYFSNYFQGIDGVQGPYQLRGKNGERRILIIAGSERVYLNGVLMTRGENNDYVIDYASGEITFSSKRLITNASRITVDFEYSDQQYTRNFLASSLSGAMINNSLKLNLNFAQEADDPDSPIGVSLDDSLREILRNSGADLWKASVPGLVYAGRGSTGKGSGLYALKDTAIDGKIYSILVYMPGDSNALYQVRFSPVSYVPPDSAGYDRVSIGQYKFAGIGKGSYMPVQFLPMPQLRRLVDINGTVNMTKDFSISGEYAESYFNQNRFSNLNDVSLKGNGIKMGAKYNPKNIMIGKRNYGELDVEISERYVDKKFMSLDRMNEIEFDRKWDVSELLSANEEIREISFGYKPISNIKGLFSYGMLERKGYVKSTRNKFDFSMVDTVLPSIQYRVEGIKARNIATGINSNWVRQFGIVTYGLLNLEPSLRYETEERLLKRYTMDSLYSGSFRFTEISPKLTAQMLKNMAISAEMQFRTEDSAHVGRLIPALKSFTQIYDWQLNDQRLITSSFTLSLRKVAFTNEYLLKGNSNLNNMMLRFQARCTPFQKVVESNLYYEYCNQRSARLEKVFAQVAKGYGTYRYLGDVNGNGVIDESDFEQTRFDGDYIVVLTPGEQLSQVASLKSSVRLHLRPATLFQNKDNWIAKTLRALSTETYLRLDENSMDPESKHIYMMNLKYFLNELNTISGSQQVMQDLHICENDQRFSMRIRFNERRGLTNFVSSSEKTYIRERSIRIRLQLVEEIANQTEFINKRNELFGTLLGSRDQNLKSNYIRSDFSYKPFRDWEIGFGFGLAGSMNSLMNKNAVAYVNEESIRIIRAFPSVGQLKLEIIREEVNVYNISNPTYDMTFGKSKGRTYLWNADLNYYIAKYVQLSMNYNGRIQNGMSAFHYVRMEARAIF